MKSFNSQSENCPYISSISLTIKPLKRLTSRHANVTAAKEDFFRGITLCFFS